MARSCWAGSLCTGRPDKSGAPVRDASPVRDAAQTTSAPVEMSQNELTAVLIIRSFMRKQDCYTVKQLNDSLGSPRYNVQYTQLARPQDVTAFENALQFLWPKVKANATKIQSQIQYRDIEFMLAEGMEASSVERPYAVILTGVDPRHFADLAQGKAPAEQGRRL